MLVAGQVLQGRYQLQEQLRCHPVRQTWLAFDQLAMPPQKTWVIIKLLAFGRGMQWDELKLFERESQVLKHLDHPQIPKYLHSFHIEEPEPWVGLIEEYIPGTSLQTLIQQGHRFAERDIYDLATQILGILIYLHEHTPPILHRDIKPSNLILTPDHTVFLVDFGAVQHQQANPGESFTVVGTYGYTPMEQFGGQAVPASDLYSLGASIVHLLTGHAPAELIQPDLRFQFRDGLRPVNGLRTASNGYYISLSPSLATWLEQITAPTLVDRFKSARAALNALQPPRSPETPFDISDHQSLRLQIDPHPEQLRVHIHRVWSNPLNRIQDLAGMTVLTILGPLVMGGLALFPFGIIFTHQALTTGDMGGISIGLLLLCFGAIPWFTGLNWLKQALTTTLIESTDDRLVIKYQLWGWTYWQQVKTTTDIASIYPLPIHTEENIVMISFEHDPPLQLANKLNTQDSQVLIQTLQQWLAHKG